MSIGIDSYRERVGQELGVSDWLLIDQAMIDKFAEATGDHQYIHVDPERAAATPMGGTIAHGFLTLALYPQLREMASVARPSDIRFGLNYGGNRTRFLAPVRSGSRVRGRFRLLAIEEKSPGRFQETIEYTLEVEGEERPALVAEWIAMMVF